MPFIGNTPQTQSFAPAVDYFSGNGVTVTFTLSRPVVSVAQLTVAVDNVIQNPSSAFTVSGNSITFTSAPLSGTNNIWVEYTSLITTYAAISQDPSVIGDITATGGFLAEGDFGNSYIDGTIVDYVTGNARITTGPIDDMTFYHGGTSGRSEMMKLSYAGNSYIVGNLGVGDTSPAGSANYTQLSIKGTNGAELSLKAGATQYGYIYGDNGGLRIINPQSGSASGTMQFSTSNTERMRIDSSGNVGVGTTSSGNKFEVAGSGMFSGAVTTNTTGTHISYQSGNSQIGAWGPDTSTNGTLVFFSARSNGVNGLERMRITSAGNLLVGTTTVRNSGIVSVDYNGNTAGGMGLNDTASANGSAYIGFLSGGTFRGSITNNNNAAVAYNTTSDYRLKENIAPMTGALAKVAQLKPCTYTWKETGEQSQGFIAHELAEVCPDAVTGEKDAVDSEGNPKYQGVDTSFLVATLTAAIQELKAEVDSLKAQLEAK